MKKSGANKILYDKRVLKEDLSRLDSVMRKRVLAAIESKLTTHPHIYGEPLHFELRGYWRLRAADWRIIYEILDKNTVLIHMIGHRSDVYDQLKRRN